jgi:hypothetical protein
MEKIKVSGRLYFYCEKCRRKFMFEKTLNEHKCEAARVVASPMDFDLTPPPECP